jgi:hypothetical protein
MMTIDKVTSLMVKIKQQGQTMKLRDGQRLLLSHCNSLGDKIVDKTANAMWSSGFPATHALLSHIVRRAGWAKNTIVPLLCIAAALEIAEELF